MPIVTKREPCSSFLTIHNDVGLTLILSSRGASVYAVIYKGKVLTMAPEDKTVFLGDPIQFYGQTIGPIALRVKGSKYKVGEREFAFPPNEYPNANHSSSWNWGFRDFGYTVEENEAGFRVVFTLEDKPDPNVGVPAHVEVAYSLSRDYPMFHLEYDIVPEEDGFFRPTNHIYWNLGVPQVAKLKLELPAYAHLGYDRKFLPMEDTLALEDTFDFHEARPIGDHLMDPELQNHSVKGYDHCFLLNPGEIVLESEELRMRLRTSGKAVQIYTDNYAVVGQELFGQGKHERFAGVTFETLYADPRETRPIRAGSHLTLTNVYTFDEIA